MHYVDDVKTISGYRNTDIIDIRPKVSNFSVAESVRSPLEFYGRTFNASEILLLIFYHQIHLLFQHILSTLEELIEFS